MKKFFVLICIAIAIGSGCNACAQNCNCMVALDETFAVVPFSIGTAPEYRNDDGFSSAIDLPFSFDHYGNLHNAIYISNNGYLLFDSTFIQPDALGFSGCDSPMIAPFWGDADTRGTNSGLVYYRVTDHECIVRYNNVGYYNLGDNYLNDFQVIISDGTSSLIPDGQHISFCYGDMQWATSGTGFEGVESTVGVCAGDGVNEIQIGLFMYPGDYFTGIYSELEGIDYLDNAHFYFSTNSLGENQSPVSISNYCDTIIGNPGDSLAFFFNDPDAGQEIDYDLETENPGDIEGEEGFGGLTVVDGNILAARPNRGDRDNNPFSYIVYIAEDIQDGTYPFTITATDNGSPALSVSHDYVLQIGAVSAPEIAPLSSVTAYIANNEIVFQGLDRSKGFKVFVFDATGKVVLSDNTRNTISTRDLSSGIYLYTIQNGSQLVSGKISK